MKRLLLTACSALLSCATSSAQGMKVMSGTTVKLIDAPYIMVLADGAHLENNAAVSLDSLIVKGTGNTASELRGSAPLAIKAIDVSKDAGIEVKLMKDVTIHNTITFNTGLLDLNNHIATLGTGGSLVTETETSRAVGSNGGEIWITEDLNGPLAVQPGNLGLIITSGANWGPTIVKRGHKSQTNAANTGSSILRYYDVVPTNNSNLFAFLRYYYKDAELNSIPEASLEYERSDDGGASWTSIGFNGRNTTQNYVDLNGLQTMARFTLSTPANPLFLQLTSWTGKCEQGIARLSWQTSDVTQIKQFVLSKSMDARTWIEVTSVTPIAGTLQYEAMDKDPYSYYRLAAKGFNGQESLSPLVTIDCGAKGSKYVLQNNLSEHNLRVLFHSDKKAQYESAVLDANGKLISRSSYPVTVGSNQLSVALPELSAGIYYLVLSEGSTQVWQTKFAVQ